MPISRRSFPRAHTRLRRDTHATSNAPAHTSLYPTYPAPIPTLKKANKDLLLCREGAPSLTDPHPSCWTEFSFTAFVPALYSFQRSHPDYRDFLTPVSISLLLPHSRHRNLFTGSLEHPLVNGQDLQSHMKALLPLGRLVCK
jgi:hypothetical protein